MALWEAPITATVRSLSDGRIVLRREGLSAGSRCISWILETGRGPVVGEEPVQRTRRLEVEVNGSELWGFFSSATFTSTVQLPD